jgi:hypothetical protein
MIKISPAEFGRVAALFERDGPNSNVAFAVLEGRNPGRVYADDGSLSGAAPRWSMVVAQYGDWAFYGGPLDHETFTSALAQVRRTQALLLTWPLAWEGRVTRPEPSQMIERLEFLDIGSDVGRSGSVPAPLPEGCTIRRMDEVWVARCLWYDEVLGACGTVSNFLQHGLGYCLMDGDAILAEAYALFRGAGRFEIGAVTAKEHRRHGNAHALCSHLCAVCLAQGTAPYWSCHRENSASAATARRLGFRTERPYWLLVYPQVA